MTILKKSALLLLPLASLHAGFSINLSTGMGVDTLQFGETDGSGNDILGDKQKTATATLCGPVFSVDFEIDNTFVVGGQYTYYQNDVYTIKKSFPGSNNITLDPEHSMGVFAGYNLTDNTNIAATFSWYKLGLTSNDLATHDEHTLFYGLAITQSVAVSDQLKVNAMAQYGQGTLAGGAGTAFETDKPVQSFNARVGVNYHINPDVFGGSQQHSEGGEHGAEDKNWWKQQ